METEQNEELAMLAWINQGIVAEMCLIACIIWTAI